MPLWIICDRWIDEVKGWRCVLLDGHDGPCRHETPRPDLNKKCDGPS